MHQAGQRHLPIRCRQFSTDKVDTIFRGGDWLYSTIGLGAQYSNTFNADWSMYASVRTGYRFRDASNADGVVQRGILGATYRPSRDMKIQLTGITELDLSESEAIANVEVGARLSAAYDFDPDLSFAERKWTVEGYGQVLSRHFLDDDPAVALGLKREDLDLRLGAKLTAHLMDGFFVTTGVDWLDRGSNIPQFEGDEVLISLLLGLDF